MGFTVGTIETFDEVLNFVNSFEHWGWTSFHVSYILHVHESSLPAAVSGFFSFLGGKKGGLWWKHLLCWMLNATKS